MEFKVVQGDITEQPVGAVVVNLFEGVSTPGGATGIVDRALDGVITRLIREGEIKGKKGETTLIHTLGKMSPSRVLVLGLGKDSGFEAEYRFTVTPGVDCSDMRAVVERPALYNVVLNGSQLAPKNGEWWLDKSFGVYDIGTAVREGENILTLRSSPFTIFTEIEPVYLLCVFR